MRLDSLILFEIASSCLFSEAVRLSMPEREILSSKRFNVSSSSLSCNTQAGTSPTPPKFAKRFPQALLQQAFQG
jgi:hypothetical protein